MITCTALSTKRRKTVGRKNEYLIHQSACVVRNFLTLERDLGRGPTWDEFVEVAYPGRPPYTLKARSILRDLWKALVLPELARIVQCFDEELLSEKFYADLYDVGVYIACEMKKVSGTRAVTAEDVLVGTTGPYGIIGLIERAGPVYDELTVAQKEKLKQDLASFLDDLAEQSPIECSTGLENADSNPGDTIPF